MLEKSVRRSEGIDSIITIVVGGEIRGSKTAHAGPKKAVERVIPGRHVFDGHTVAADHDARAQFELAVQNDGIAVDAPQRDAGRGDEYGLGVLALIDQYQVARIRRIHAVLDGRIILRHAPRHTGGALDGGQHAARSRRRVLDVADHDDADHSRLAVRSGVKAAKKGIDSLFGEHDFAHVVRPHLDVAEGLLARPRLVDGEDVVIVAAGVDEYHGAADRYAHDGRGITVVRHRYQHGARRFDFGFAAAAESQSKPQRADRESSRHPTVPAD